MLTPKLDIVIPVYNEGPNIARVLTLLARDVKTPCCILICYDSETDDTLPAIRANSDKYPNLQLEFVRNRRRGAHAAVMSGFAASTAPAVVVFPADDDFNSGILDHMVSLVDEGFDVVCASRFMPGGTMQGCPWLKAVLVRTAAFTLYRWAGLPTHDPTSGFRMFARRVIEQIVVESDQGFCYSIELLVKAHRLGWRICEVPALWFERRAGQSRFRVLRWLPPYLRWYFYAYATTLFRRSPSTVPLRTGLS
jgi:dolichol-phosphate mannosyltransferase